MANTGTSSQPDGRQEPENPADGLSPQVMAAIQSAITAALAAQATQQQIGAEQARAVAQPAAAAAEAPDSLLALENYYRKLKSELEGSIPSCRWPLRGDLESMGDHPPEAAPKKAGPAGGHHRGRATPRRRREQPQCSRMGSEGHGRGRDPPRLHDRREKSSDPAYLHSSTDLVSTESQWDSLHYGVPTRHPGRAHAHQLRAQRRRCRSFLHARNSIGRTSSTRQRTSMAPRSTKSPLPCSCRVVGNALPESWEDLRKDLFRIDAADIDLEDIAEAPKSFRAQQQGEGRGAFRAQGGEQRPAPEISQEPQANRAGPGQRAVSPKRTRTQLCPHCQRGHHLPSQCFSAIRSEYLRYNPGATPPTHDWMRGVVGKGKHLPFNWISILREFSEGAPTSRPATPATSKPIGHLGQAYSAYLQTQGKNPAPPSMCSTTCVNKPQLVSMCSTAYVKISYQCTD